mmetsp:Transcript_61158/g.161783  ORF Transcript_61158/g.161783 Transcript_61158/m.161783 type:complete len:236 (-) Transcript_61158:402-1109(-)
MHDRLSSKAITGRGESAAPPSSQPIASRAHIPWYRSALLPRRSRAHSARAALPVSQSARQARGAASLRHVVHLVRRRRRRRWRRRSLEEGLLGEGREVDATRGVGGDGLGGGALDVEARRGRGDQSEEERLLSQEEGGEPPLLDVWQRATNARQRHCHLHRVARRDEHRPLVHVGCELEARCRLERRELARLQHEATEEVGVAHLQHELHRRRHARPPELRHVNLELGRPHDGEL